MYHNPVLLHKSIEGLNIKPDGIYVDVTFGGGGHSMAILEQLKNGRLYAFDQDIDAVRNAISDERFTLIAQNFRYLKNFLKLHGVTSVDGILADLGVSSHQFDIAERGFSTRLDGRLDMRMNQSAPLSAYDIINTYSVEELNEIFRDYGELKNSYKVAKAIVSARNEHDIETTGELISAVKSCFAPNKLNKSLAMLFQALRIVVNDEIDALKDFLTQATEILVPGGRLVVISYHSLEDRLVKNLIKTGNFEGKLHKDFYGNPLVSYTAVNRKVIVPDEEEIKTNSRARSARMRIAERTEMSNQVNDNLDDQGK
jgi:16S rRNA (cytosine1402-N4)-methyltransferase